MNDLTNTPAVVDTAPEVKPKRKPRKPRAPKAEKMSVADFARELKIDPKTARRRLRANTAKTGKSKLPEPKFSAGGRKNSRWNFDNTAEAKKLVKAIIVAD